MNLAWLVLSAAVEIGSFSAPSHIFDFDATKDITYGTPLYTMLSADAQAGPLFVAGSVETEFFWSDGGKPFDATYTFGMGLRFGSLEIGWTHFCMHPVEWSVNPIATPYQRFAGLTDRVYVRMEVKK